MLEEGSGLVEGTRLPPGVLARAGAHRPGLRRPAQVPQARRRPRRRAAAPARPRLLRGGARLRRAAGPRRAATASGTSGRPRRPRWPSSPRPPTATSTSGWPTSSRVFAEKRRHRRLPGDRGVATRSPTATSTGPASPSAATASRSTRASTCPTTRTRPSSEPPARPTPGCPTTPSAASRSAYGDLTGARVVVLGAAYRGGVKETAFSGVFATVRVLLRARRRGDRPRPDVLRRGARRDGLRAVPPRVRRSTPW